MKENYSQRVTVRKAEDHISLESTINFEGASSPETETVTYPSFAKAKKTLSREKKLYQGLQYGHELLIALEAISVFYGIEKLVVDVVVFVESLPGENKIGEDTIRTLLVAMFGIATIANMNRTHNNAINNDNKLETIRAAEVNPEDYTSLRY